MKVLFSLRWLWRGLTILLVLIPIIPGNWTERRANTNWPVPEITIALPERWRNDSAIDLAVQDLRDLLKTGYQIELRIAGADDLAELPEYALIVGEIEDRWPSLLRHTAGLNATDLATDGYVIQRVRFRAKPFLAVVGGSVLGSAYGLFQLIERLRLTPELLFDHLLVRADPRMTFRLVSSPTGPPYPTPEQALRWGYNAVMIEPWPGLALYDNFDARIYDPSVYGVERTWIEDNRERAREQIRQAKALHLQVVSSGDVFSFPQQVLGIYGSGITAADDQPLLCPEKPKTLLLLQASLDEVLTDFPEIDAVMVRTGENYTLANLRGNGPAVGQENACAEMSDEARLRLVINLIKERVVDAHGKTYIHRAWSLGDQGFHANPTVAAAITKDLPSSNKVIVSFKHTETDFWRYNAVNPNIGVGQLTQMVEFQCAREFEGKGAFPDYLGEEFAEGGPEVSPSGGVAYAVDRGVRSIWVWAKGGGWDGPTLQSDLWVEANIFAISKLAWDPGQSPRALALTWANLRFGPKAAPWVANALMRSDDAVLLGLYTRAFALKQGAWVPNYLWVRDDIIQGGYYVAPLYNASRAPTDFETALAEKQRALRLVDEMIGDLAAAVTLAKNRSEAQQALNTVLYEKALFRVLDRYLTGLFYFYRWTDSGRLDDYARRQSLVSLQEWREAWDEYRTTAVSLPGVASPFRDRGMEQAVSEALDQMSR